MKISMRENSSSFAFNAMKPNQFSGTDYAVVRKFKAPVEKFKAHSDFYAWVKNKLDSILTKVYKGRTFSTEVNRKLILNSWNEFFQQNSECYSVSDKLLVFSSLVKKLKPTNELLPPDLRPSFLKSSFDLIDNLLTQNKDELFDFQNIYYKQIQNKLVDPIAKIDGWIVIPSKKNDSVNFDDNVMKLQLLSPLKWCTKSYYAKSYLSSGDFHVYLEGGIPKVGIRFSGSEIVEIQGGKNNSKIPTKYINEVKSHIKKGDYFTSCDVEYFIQQSELAKI